MATRTMKRAKPKTEWDKLSKNEQRRLLDDYLWRVLSGKPTKKLSEKIARLKGIPYRRSPGRKTIRFA